VGNGELTSPGGEAPTVHPGDRALLAAVQQGNAWLRGVACTLARRGVAFREEHPERAEVLLDALASWPLYKAGQFLFDLLELEDFMLDGDEPSVVTTTLDPAALHRLAGFLRSLRRHIDGAAAQDGAELVTAASTAPEAGRDLPPLEAGFYLYQDVVLGILESTRPLVTRER
jgi:hypothetical protein